ncbi:MAG: hypothetical protein ACOYI6_11595 [Christensenellales bacterium]|jgi:hypothetical protein
MTNNLKYLESIESELLYIVYGPEDDIETTEYTEYEDMFNWLNDQLDIEYTISGRGEYLGALITITIGGPGVALYALHGEAMKK